MSTLKADKEKELTDHLLSKDAKRFEFLFDHFSSALYGIINRIVKHDEQAEDILQEVFVKIWNSSAGYDAKRSRLFTWMLNIARNTAIDYIRSKQGRFEKKRQTIDSYVSNYGGGLVTVNHEHIGLKKIVSDLKEDQKEIIDLAFFQGYTQIEIVEKLQIPLGTVKTKCRRAISILRKSLECNELF